MGGTVLTARIKNDKLVTGMVIVTRSDRGNITAQHVVTEVSRVCTDPSNLHVAARDRKTNSTANWCMFGNSESEVQI